MKNRNQEGEKPLKLEKMRRHIAEGAAHVDLHRILTRVLH
jgi:hypothetical protein